MSNADLQNYITSEVDFYELLNLGNSTPSESELRRAYRKTALLYHPDKVGTAFDPAKYELFQAANEILSDPELKAKYDNHRQAKLQKQRANELFEGKRRQMKEDLEAREKAGGAIFTGAAGMKRARGEGEDEHIRTMAELGRMKRAEMARKSMAAEKEAASSPAARTVPVASTTQTATPSKAPPPPPTVPVAAEEEDEEIARIERKIREAKARRKADKKARKSEIFTQSTDSPSTTSSEPTEAGRSKWDDLISNSKERSERKEEISTPIKRPDVFRGLKADDSSSASPKFSFSPAIATPKKMDFAATMARLKDAEKKRLEEQIRAHEAGTAE